MHIPKIACVLISFVITATSLLALWVCYQQAYHVNIKTMAYQLQELKHNLQKNYITNLRIIDHKSSCNENEQVVEGIIYDNQKEYKLQYLVVDHQNNTGQVVQICQQSRYDSSFASSLQNKGNQTEQEIKKCDYKGVKVGAKDLNQCPISNIQFSSEESIEGYEKIDIEGNTKTKLFILRNKLSSTPLVGLNLKQKGEIPFLNQAANLIYNMKNICQEKYMSYESLCQFESNPSLYKLEIIQESQYPMDQECSELEVLNFDKNNLYLNGSFIKLFDYILAHAMLIFNILIIIISIIIIFHATIYISLFTQYIKPTIVNLIYFYLIKYDYEYLNTVVEKNCFYGENLFDDFQTQSKELVYYLNIYYMLQGALIVLAIILGIFFSKGKEQEVNQSENKFSRINEEEMTFTN